MTETAAALITVRDLRLQGEDIRFWSTDPLDRLRRGVYVESAEWESAGYEQRHVFAIDAVVATRRSQPVISHVSAAILWGIPIVGPHLHHVHLAACGRPRVRSKNGVVWHHEPVPDEEIVELDGRFVTSYERTLTDVARMLPFASAVAALDHGCREQTTDRTGKPIAGVIPERLVEVFEGLGTVAGIRRARASLDFVDVRSGSPGESISRANMHLLHFPAPELQVPFTRADGGVDIADFDWPALRTFGEFDGLGKYLKPELMNGRTEREVVMAEKERENRIRKHRPFGARWDWRIAMEPSLLRTELMQAGLRPTR
ncbi:hypothetical protein [Agromyces bauzanensis]